MNYQYEYITLKAKHERVKLLHDAKIEKLNRQIAELRAMIIQPVTIPKFDLDMGDVITLVSKVTDVFPMTFVTYNILRKYVSHSAD